MDSESENKEGDDEELTFTDVTESLSTASGDGQFSLLPHYRCASHTINLISTSDIDKHLNSVQTPRLYIGVVLQNALLFGLKQANQH